MQQSSLPAALADALASPSPLDAAATCPSTAPLCWPWRVGTKEGGSAQLPAWCAGRPQPGVPQARRPSDVIHSGRTWRPPRCGLAAGAALAAIEVPSACSGCSCVGVIAAAVSSVDAPPSFAAAAAAASAASAASSSAAASAWAVVTRRRRGGWRIEGRSLYTIISLRYSGWHGGAAFTTAAAGGSGAGGGGEPW